MEKDYILCVEDNPNDVVLMQRVFEKDVDNVSVKFINDGEAAIEFLNSEAFKSSPPQLITLDIKTPKRTGLEVLEYFKSHYKNMTIPVVMLSSSDRADEVKKSYDLGANSYVEKPKNFVELKRKLIAITDYWLNTNRS